MSTNSHIGKQNADGTITAIYCHWDGYPDSVGATLRDHYTNPAKIDQLLALGDLSVLGPELGVKHRFEDYDPNICNVYGRDRGEKNTKARIYKTVEDFCAQQYNYLWTGDEWIGFNSDGPLPPSHTW